MERRKFFVRGDTEHALRLEVPHRPSIMHLHEYIRRACSFQVSRVGRGNLSRRGNLSIWEKNEIYRKTIRATILGTMGKWSPLKRLSNRLTLFFQKYALCMQREQMCNSKGTLKYDATQPIIRYWLNSGSNNFVSCLTEFWNLSFSELWILHSYWILLKTEFRLNSFKSELSQIWPNDSSCFTPKVD